MRISRSSSSSSGLGPETAPCLEVRPVYVEPCRRIKRLGAASTMNGAGGTARGARSYGGPHAPSALLRHVETGSRVSVPSRSIWARRIFLDATDPKKRLDRSPVIHGGVRLTDMIKVRFEVEDRRWVNHAIEHVIHEFRDVHARRGDTAT